MKILNKIFESTIFRYGVAGGIAALCDIGIFNTLIHFAGAYYITAVVFSNTVSFFIRFFLQKYYAFRAHSRENIKRQFILYGILFVVSVALTAFCMFLLVEYVHMRPTIAQIISILAVAGICFMVYRHIIFPHADAKSKTPKDAAPRKILLIAQKVNIDDPVLGFFHTWIKEFSKRYESVAVICLEKGRYELPENVHVMSLGKEERQSRIQYLIHFYWYIIHERRNYDAVFVHMNQEYVILGSFFWKFTKKKVYMWRNHVHGTFRTRLAILLSTKVFCTSTSSFTAGYKKTSIMPVGINTDSFRRLPEISRTPRSILFLSRIAPVKKPELLLEALRDLKHKNIGFTASFYGDPLKEDEAYYEILKTKTREYGLSDRVTWYPAISNDKAIEVYNKHEISLNMSPKGLFDKTILEAMATESLVLVSNDDLADHIDGLFIFEENDVISLSLHLEKILDLSQEDKNKNGDKLRKVVVENHSLTKLLDKIVDHISKP